MADSDSEPLLENTEPSKSALKRRMTDLRQLADALCRLPDADLLGFELSDDLIDSLQTARRLKSSNARNRQLRHASKLLDKHGEDVIGNATGHFDKQRLQAQSFNQHHKLIENWRDRLLTDPNQGIQALIESFPEVDRQEIRTLVRLAAKEKTLGKSPAQQRKLFCYLRDQVLG